VYRGWLRLERSLGCGSVRQSAQHGGGRQMRLGDGGATPDTESVGHRAVLGRYGARRPTGGTNTRYLPSWFGRAHQCDVAAVNYVPDSWSGTGHVKSLVCLTSHERCDGLKVGGPTGVLDDEAGGKRSPTSKGPAHGLGRATESMPHRRRTFEELDCVKTARASREDLWLYRAVASVSHAGTEGD